MTKTEMLGIIEVISKHAETHPNALIRADMVESLVELATAIMELPDESQPDPWLSTDYAITRSYLADCYKREKPFTQRKTEAVEAGRALNRLAEALGVDVTKPVAAPQPQQVELFVIGRPVAHAA